MIARYEHLLKSRPSRLWQILVRWHNTKHRNLTF